MKFYQSGLSFFRKTALDECLYKLSAGRSMVEMLGVLAIIGVLSVGAIAGYSKAMMKYKLNKQTEQLSWLLNVMYQYKSQWIFDDRFVSLLPYYKKLGLIPENMLKDSNYYLYDVFGQKIEMTTNACNPVCTGLILRYRINNGSLELCSNVIKTISNFHEVIYGLGMGQSEEDESSYQTYFLGDKYCTTKCLKSLSLQQIDEMCRTCEGTDSCSIYATYQIND